MTKKNGDKGIIIVLSGPSGSGKTTLRDLLMRDGPIKRLFSKAVSFTTRSKRKGEKEGRDYFFVSKKEFFKLRKTGRVLEWTNFLGNYYGTDRGLVNKTLATGKGIFLCLDLKGFLRVKRFYPQHTLGVFILPPSINELRRRIVNRSEGTGEKEITKRLNLAKKELKNASRYDYALRNVDLKKTVSVLKNIILEKIF